MKKILFLAAICGLITTACIPSQPDNPSGNNTTPSEDVSPSEEDSKDPGGEKKDLSEPEGAVSGWILKTYNSSGALWRTSEVTFIYDAKGRVCEYDETEQWEGLSPDSYKRIYHWVTDDKVEFHNTSLSHVVTACWELQDGRTVHYYIPSDEYDDMDDWTVSYTSDGHLDQIFGYHYIYIDTDDEERCKDWDKVLSFTWNDKGNLTDMAETWTGTGGEKETRNAMVLSYKTQDNPFFGQKVDPTAYFIFREMYLGMYGLTSKSMLLNIIFKDETLYMARDGYYFDYGYCEDGILRDIRVDRVENGIKTSYNIHILYFGIEDKDSYEIPVIN